MFLRNFVILPQFYVSPQTLRILNFCVPLRNVEFPRKTCVPLHNFCILPKNIALTQNVNWWTPKKKKKTFFTKRLFARKTCFPEKLCIRLPTRLCFSKKLCWFAKLVFLINFALKSQSLFPWETLRNYAFHQKTLFAHKNFAWPRK